MDDNVQDICRVCRSEGSTEKPMYHPCICTGNIATIKRKPSFTPKIPLTSTTRNLAKQSDNALLDIKLSSGDDDKLLRNGTLRLKRPSTHERLNSIIMRESTTTTITATPSTPSTQQVQCNNKLHYQKISTHEIVENNDCLRKVSNNFVVDDFDDDLDDFPLPPPPDTLTSSLSCLSLNSLPPPPSEFLDDAINNSIDFNDDITQSPVTTPTIPTTYIRPTSITSSSKSSVITTTQSPNRRHSNAKPIASPVVPPKPSNGLNGRIYETLNNQYDDSRSTNDTISISSCDSNSTSNISSVGTSSSDSNISNRYQMMRMNPPTEMLNGNTRESQISLSSSSSSIHQNNMNSLVTQSTVTTPQSKSEYQFQPHPVQNNESNNHERTDEPIYQQIPAHIETNQIQSNIIYHQPQSQKSNQQFINHQQQLQQQEQAHYQLPSNHNNYNNQKGDSIDGPIYQEVPKNIVHHNNNQSINYGINGNNIHDKRGSTISQRSTSSNGSNLSLTSNNSSSIITANNNASNNESRSSMINNNQTRNNHNNNNIINNLNDCKTSTFNNSKMEIAASFNYPVHNRSPMRGPLPAPPEVFLQDIHRVMDKKWKVAQKLSHDSSQTLNQLVLGYRDPYDQMIQMIQMNEMLCLDELLNQQPLPTSPTSFYHHHQQQQQNNQQNHPPPPPPPPAHYETPPSLNNQNNNHQHAQFNQQHQNFHHSNHQQHQHHNSPQCQQIDELPEYDHNHLSTSSSSSSNSTQFINNNLNTNMKVSSSSHYNGVNIQQQQQSTNQDIPVPPPPVLRCTNSSLFDKPLLRNKSGPPPPPRRSDKTRLSGRYQMRNETRTKPNHQ